MDELTPATALRTGWIRAETWIDENGEPCWEADWDPEMDLILLLGLVESIKTVLIQEAAREDD